MGKREGLRPRCSRAGGLPRSLEKCTGSRLVEVAPLDIVRNANGVVSVKRENNVKEGTPGVAPYPRGFRCGPGTHGQGAERTGFGGALMRS